MSNLRSSITIDLLIRGLERVERLGSVLQALVSNPRVIAGFQVLYGALGNVSRGAQQLVGGFARFASVLATISQDPRFQDFARGVAAALRQINEQLNGTARRARTTSDALKQFSLGLGVVSILIRSVGFLIRDLGLNLLRTSQRITAFFKELVKSGGDIEQKFSELQGLLSEPTQATAGFQALKEEIISVGEVSSKSISEVAGLSLELARAGFSAEDITASIRSVVQLSEAAGLSAENAAEIAANVKTMFSLQASELSRVNDVLTQTANASTTSVQSLGESFTYVGPLASAFGFSVEEVAAALGVLANAGQKGSVAGAGLQQMFSQLISHADDVDAVLQRHGSSFEKVNPEIHSVVEIMAEFNRVNLDTSEIIGIFSERARKTFLALNSQGIEVLRTFEQMNRNANGLAAAVAETRMDNVSGDVLRLKSAIEALKFEIFDIISEKLRGLVQNLTDLINRFREYASENQNVVASLADLAIKFAAFSGLAAGVTLAMSTITRTVGLFVGSLATIMATITMLFGPLRTFFGYIASSAAVIRVAVSNFGLLTGILRAVQMGFASLSTFMGATLLGFTGFIIPLGALVAIIAAVIIHWDKLSAAMTKFYYSTWLPVYYGFVHGFMEGYEKYIAPAIEELMNSLGFLGSQITDSLGKGSGAYSSFERVGKYVAVLAAGFVHLTDIIVNAVSGFISFFSAVYKNVVELFKLLKSFGDWLDGLDGAETPDAGDSAATAAKERIKSLGQVAAEYRREMRLAIEAHNEFMDVVSSRTAGMDALIPQYEKAGSLLSRITNLTVNELKEFKRTLEDIDTLGGDFSAEGISNELADLELSIADLQKSTESWKESLSSKEYQQMLAGLGENAEHAKKTAEEMYQQQQKLLQDYIEKRNKLLSTKSNFDLLALVTGSKDFTEFEGKQKELKKQLLEAQQLVKDHMDRIQKLQLQAAGFSAGGGAAKFKTEAERQAAIEAAKQELSNAQAQLQALQQQFGMMGQIGTDVIFNRIKNAVAGSDKPLQALAEAMLNFHDASAKAAAATKEWEEAQKELKSALDSSKETIENLNKEIASYGLDEQSKMEFDIKVNTEQAIKSITEFETALLNARQKALAAGADTREIDKRLAELNKLKVAYAAHGARQTADVETKADEERIEQQLDMELDLAKKRKDQAQELALTQQKWHADTAKEVEERYMEIDSAGNRIRRAGADEYERLRQQQLQEEIDEINQRYADATKKAAEDTTQKKPIDRAKEMVDIQNEAYQILLKKVQSTKDLFALERALLKIQEMQLVASLKMSSRAIRAETSVSRYQKLHDEALARGDDPRKTGEDLKRAQERAAILRGTSDLRNRQMGIGTSDVNALTVARQAMEMTSTIIMQRIGEKMKIIGDALNGMTMTFSSIAETWIDSFIESWDKNSVRMQDAILATLNNLNIGLNTAALGNPVTGVAGAGIPLATAGVGGNSIVNNFQVTAIDPEEAGKRISRLINQSMRDS